MSGERHRRSMLKTEIEITMLWYSTNGKKLGIDVQHIFQECTTDFTLFGCNIMNST